MQAFAFDASNQRNDDGSGFGGVDSDGGGFLSEGDGDGEDPEDMAALQMECTVHEVLLKNQVSAAAVPFLKERDGCSHRVTIAAKPRSHVEATYGIVRLYVRRHTYLFTCEYVYVALPDGQTALSNEIVTHCYDPLEESRV